MMISIDEAINKLTSGKNIANKFELPTVREMSNSAREMGIELPKRKNRPPIPMELREAAAISGMAIGRQEAADLFNLSHATVHRGISGYTTKNTPDQEFKKDVREGVDVLLEDVRKKATSKLDSLLDQISTSRADSLTNKELAQMISSVASAVSKTNKSGVSINVDVDNRKATFVASPQKTEEQYETVVVS